MASVSLKNLDSAKQKSDYCLKTFPENRECLWMAALINIHLGDIEAGKQLIEKAKEKGYYVDGEIGLRQLVAAYLETKNYKEMLPLYQKLSEINKKEVQYRISLMICYKELRNYQMARQIGLEIIESNPELKPSIDAFLRTLYQ